MEQESNNKDEASNEDLQKQLIEAKQQVDHLTQQLNCLVILAQKAWHGDEAASIHLARVIGIDPSTDQNSFIEKQSSQRSASKKTVKISDNTDEIPSRKTPDVSSVSSEENLPEQPDMSSTTTFSRNSYLHPFHKQNHIDPIGAQNTRQILSKMMRHHQNETSKGPILPNPRTPSGVRPRATKHLYRPASAENVVRHLGTPVSRNRPFFIFAGREFFQKTTNYSPLYQRALSTSNAVRSKRNQEFLEQSELLGSTVVPDSTEASSTTYTNKSFQQSSTFRTSNRSIISDTPKRSSSAMSSASSSKMTQMSDRERRDTVRLQRQLNLPRRGWVTQQV